MAKAKNSSKYEKYIESQCGGSRWITKGSNPKPKSKGVANGKKK